ncbi:hypothetical protein HK101_011970 [Irineochytrium annulatum]|nr:hypothetical protein HK101_011970 [Irineochytrium annulatum]
MLGLGLRKEKRIELRRGDVAGLDAAVSTADGGVEVARDDVDAELVAVTHAAATAAALMLVMKSAWGANSAKSGCVGGGGGSWDWEGWWKWLGLNCGAKEMGKGKVGIVRFGEAMVGGQA